MGYGGAAYYWESILLLFTSCTALVSFEPLKFEWAIIKLQCINKALLRRIDVQPNLIFGWGTVGLCAWNVNQIDILCKLCCLFNWTGSSFFFCTKHTVYVMGRFYQCHCCYLIWCWWGSVITIPSHASRRRVTVRLRSIEFCLQRTINV